MADKHSLLGIRVITDQDNTGHKIIYPQFLFIYLYTVLIRRYTWNTRLQFRSWLSRNVDQQRVKQWKERDATFYMPCPGHGEPLTVTTPRNARSWTTVMLKCLVQFS